VWLLCGESPHSSHTFPRITEKRFKKCKLKEVYYE